MPPFRFRLEQVLSYRKRLEEEAMQALADAVMRRDALRDRLAALQSAVEEQRLRLCRPDLMEAGEMAMALDYCGALQRDMDFTRQALAEAETLVDARRVALIEKSRERGLLDRLKEKQALRHIQCERQHEQRINDETATLRYKPAAF